MAYNFDDVAEKVDDVIGPVDYIGTNRRNKTNNTLFLLCVFFKVTGNKEISLGCQLRVSSWASKSLLSHPSLTPIGC